MRRPPGLSLWSHKLNSYKSTKNSLLNTHTSERSMHWDIWRWLSGRKEGRHNREGQRQESQMQSSTRCRPSQRDTSEESGHNPNWEDQKGRGRNLTWVASAHWGWAQSQWQKSSAKNGSIPQAAITRQTAGVGIHRPSHFLWPTQYYNPDSANRKGAEATFLPKWSVLIVVETTRKKRATDTQTFLPLHTVPPPIMAQPGRGS